MSSHFINEVCRKALPNWGRSISETEAEKILREALSSALSEQNKKALKAKHCRIYDDVEPKIRMHFFAWKNGNEYYKDNLDFCLKMIEMPFNQLAVDDKENVKRVAKGLKVKDFILGNNGNLIKDWIAGWLEEWKNEARS